MKGTLSVLVSTLQTPIKTRGSVCKVRTQATDIRITIDIRVHGQPTNKRLLKVDRVLSRNLVSGNRFFVTFGRIPGERILKVTKKSGNRGSHQRATA